MLRTFLLFLDDYMISSRFALRVYLVVCTCGYLVLSYSLLTNTHNTFHQKASNVVTFTAQNLESTLKSNALVLRTLGESLVNDGALLNPEHGRARIEDAYKNAAGVVGFGLARTDGQLVLVSRISTNNKLPNLKNDPSTSESFNETLRLKQFVVGKTYYMEALKAYVLPMRVPILDANKDVVAVMTGGLRLDSNSFTITDQNVFDKFNLYIFKRYTGDILYVNTQNTTIHGDPYTSKLPADIFNLVEKHVLAGEDIDITYHVLPDSYNYYSDILNNNIAVVGQIKKEVLFLSYVTQLLFPTTLFILLMLVGIRFNHIVSNTIRNANDQISELDDWRNTVLDSTDLSIISTDIKGTIVSFNKGAQHILGYTPEEVIGMHTPLIFHDPIEVKKRKKWIEHQYNAPVQDDFDALVRQPIVDARSDTRECTYIRKDGTRVSVVLNVNKLTNSNGELTGYVGIAYDISDRKKAENELKIAAIAFESQEGMVVTDECQRILRVNNAFTKITGYTLEDVIGQTPKFLQSGKTTDAEYKRMWKALNEVGQWQGEIYSKRKDGSLFQELLTITTVCNERGDVTNYVSTFMDITDRKDAEVKIQKLAFYDPLTGLPNRRLLMERLQHAVLNSEVSKGHCALMFMDLDNFKALNDTKGHSCGDSLLMQVSERLTSVVKTGDTVARLGGDEFVIMLENLPMDAAHAALEAEDVGERMLKTLTNAYTIENESYFSSASIGVTIFSGNTYHTNDLIKQADMAMYQAKSDGKNMLRFFNKTMQDIVSERVELERDFRIALDDGQFVIYLQPQVDVSGILFGAEALVRWIHPVKGLIPPMKFIPFAEESNLIGRLGAVVFEQACKTLSELPGEYSTLQIAVNVSPRQFTQKSFVSDVVSTVARYGINPARIKFELTESLLLDNVEDTIGKMFILKEKGFSFALDDFGTGYSSLMYLKKLPFDLLKIDQSFVRDLLTDPNDAAIAETVIALGRSLKIDILAEGVEEKEQLEFLKSKGCHKYQGYLIGKPMPIDAFYRYLKEYH